MFHRGITLFLCYYFFVKSAQYDLPQTALCCPTLIIFSHFATLRHKDTHTHTHIFIQTHCCICKASLCQHQFNGNPSVYFCIGKMHWFSQWHFYWGSHVMYLCSVNALLFILCCLLFPHKVPHSALHITCLKFTHKFQVYRVHLNAWILTISPYTTQINPCWHLADIYIQRIYNKTLVWWLSPKHNLQ